jgi:hypothetical protein
VSKQAGKPLTVDRRGWKKGPWDSEPDRFDWTTAAGLPAFGLRIPRSGHWCCYVDIDDFVVHGGITYGPAPCEGHVCHVPKAGQAESANWFGFDCCHAGDVSPGGIGMDRGCYRTVAYVRAQAEKLAAQLVGVKRRRRRVRP